MSFISSTQLQPGENEAGRDCAIVAFRGDLDAFTTTAARADLHRVLETPAVILDLTEVTFIDTAGVRVVITAARGVGAHHGTMVVVLPRGGAARQLHLVGLDRVVPTVDSLAAARVFVARPGSGPDLEAA